MHLLVISHKKSSVNGHESFQINEPTFIASCGRSHDDHKINLPFLDSNKETKYYTSIFAQCVARD